MSVQPGASQTEHRRAIAFFPVVGFLLGLAGTALYLALSLILPQAAAVVGVFMGLALTTGGLHEDGLADCADGFGGGYSRDQVLKIMRDSHIGTFGVLALGFVVSLKVISLTELVDWKFYRALVMAQVLSRWSVLPLAWALPQARSEGLGSGFSTQLRPVPILLATTFTLPLGAFLYRWYFCRPFWWRLWWWGSSAFIVFEESGVSRETAMALPSSWSNCPSICRWS